ncbi:DNA repair protein RecO [Sphingomonas sp.]|jgi:DNA repair protein RecO (recombination protein O)|uniref:DNA repair protein RecO n=1 Tax=Sphingomonas sp. TaxID=28214 RepID=UPI002E314B5E|nr:recombination protein O N-terminal domain-containing protein [Sphingomonas sp.]HEX4693296.1 recombination protein O N-terminal domain-containing protein [Sphingomonas sp.]
MHLRAQALILGVRQHGEHGAIVRAVTREAGMLAGYVRGGRSRAIRPVLQPANLVMGEWRARTEEQLAGLTVELVHSRAPLYGEPLAAAALEWVTALTAVALPEGQPYPRLYAALDAMIAAIEAAPAARGWAVALVRYEDLMLAELGYALEQPPVVDGASGWAAILTGLAETGAAIEAHLLTDRRAEALAARARLVDRLKRAVA